VFVDNGLLRHHEGDQVMQHVRRNLGVKVIRVDAEARFWPHSRASPTPRPSARSSAGCSSRCSTRRRAARAGVDWLAQGTIYPDVIESAGSKTGKAHVIKSTTTSAACPST
jgi:GMP synthase (glutamine-hydrolysing)